MNRLVIITGATGGIGKEITRLSLRSDEFMTVCAVVRDEAKLKKSMEDVSVENLSVVLYNMEDTCHSPFNAVTCDLLFDNADAVTLVLTACTMGLIDKAINLEDDIIEKTFHTNVVSQIKLVRDIVLGCNFYGFPLDIIQLDSGAAYRPISGWSLYCASKSCINLYLQTITLENPNVRLVLYDPGVVDTGMQEYIRGTTQSSFPDVAMFCDYKTNHKLNSSVSVAQDIFSRYLSQWTASSLMEQYCR